MASEEAINHLHAIFPHVGRDVIAVYLVNNGGRLDATVENLLNMPPQQPLRRAVSVPVAQTVHSQRPLPMRPVQPPSSSIQPSINPSNQSPIPHVSQPNPAQTSPPQYQLCVQPASQPSLQQPMQPSSQPAVPSTIGQQIESDVKFNQTKDMRHQGEGPNTEKDVAGKDNAEKDDQDNENEQKEKEKGEENEKDAEALELNNAEEQLLLQLIVGDVPDDFLQPPSYVNKALDPGVAAQMAQDRLLAQLIADGRLIQQLAQDPNHVRFTDIPTATIVQRRVSAPTPNRAKRKESSSWLPSFVTSLFGDEEEEDEEEEEEEAEEEKEHSKTGEQAEKRLTERQAAEEERQLAQERARQRKVEKEVAEDLTAAWNSLSSAARQKLRRIADAVSSKPESKAAPTYTLPASVHSIQGGARSNMSRLRMFSSRKPHPEKEDYIQMQEMEDIR